MSNKGELTALLYFLSLWEYYLQPGKFVVRTDHQALSWLKTMKSPAGMESRWLELLASYDFEIEHRKGVLHGNADALSRREDVETEIETDTREPRADYVCSLALDKKYSQEINWAVQQDSDADMEKVKDWVREDTWPSRNVLQAESPTVLSYAAWREKLEIHEDVLYLRDPRTHPASCIPKVCIPDHMQEEVIMDAHELGHQGIANTADRVRKRFYFPQVSKKTAEALGRCGQCLQKKRNVKGQKEVHEPVYAGHPFQKLSIDHVGPMTMSKEGNKYLLTCKDVFTRWVEAYPVPDISAATTAKVLEKEIFARYGLPESIHSDNGKSFTSKLMHDLYKELGITTTHTPYYNPKSNSVERAHGDLGPMLRALNTQGPENWEAVLPAALLAMRTSKCRTTGYSPPFYMMFGREAVLPLDLIYGAAEWDDGKDNEGYKRHEWGRQLRQRLEDAYRYARDNLKLEIRRQRRQYMLRVKLSVGDKVWLFCPKSPFGCRKLDRHWTGPYEVVEVITPVVFRIRSVGEWNSTQIELVVGMDRLRKFGERRFLIEPEVRKGMDLTAEDLNWDEWKEEREGNHVRPKSPEKQEEERPQKEANDKQLTGQLKDSHDSEEMGPEKHENKMEEEPMENNDDFQQDGDMLNDGMEDEPVPLQEEGAADAVRSDGELTDARTNSEGESDEEDPSFRPQRVGPKQPQQKKKNVPPRRSRRLLEKNRPPLRRSERLQERLQKGQAELHFHSLQALVVELIQDCPAWLNDEGHCHAAGCPRSAALR